MMNTSEAISLLFYGMNASHFVTVLRQGKADGHRFCNVLQHNWTDCKNEWLRDKEKGSCNVKRLERPIIYFYSIIQ